LDLTLSMVSEDSTSNVMVLPTLVSCAFQRNIPVRVLTKICILEMYEGTCSNRR
jgi:hypothetical protein